MPNLIPYAGPDNIESMIADLHVEIAAIQSEIEVYDKKLNSILSELNPDIQELAELKAQLEGELDALEYEEAKSEGNLSEFEAEKAEQQAPTSNRDTRRRAKAIWKRIAFRCHPDKTNNPLLHELYQTGEIAYLCLDLVTLQNILDSVNNLSNVAASIRTDARTKLLLMLDDLKAMRDKLLGVLKGKKNAPSGFIVVLYESQGPNAALQAYANIVTAEINILKHKISCYNTTQSETFTREWL